MSNYHILYNDPKYKPTEKSYKKNNYAGKQMPQKVVKKKCFRWKSEGCAWKEVSQQDVNGKASNKVTVNKFSL